MARRTSMTQDQMRAIAMGNVESNANIEEGESADGIYDEVYTLAFDALHDAGIDHDEARAMAGDIAQSFAQP